METETKVQEVIFTYREIKMSKYITYLSGLLLKILDKHQTVKSHEIIDEFAASVCHLNRYIELDGVFKSEILKGEAEKEKHSTFKTTYRSQQDEDLKDTASKIVVKDDVPEEEDCCSEDSLEPTTRPVQE
jgi:hypothetical protein